MDLMLAVAVASAAAREINEMRRANQEITEEKIAQILISNTIKIEAAVTLAKAQVEKYGG
jgi:hypothetical protein